MLKSKVGGGSSDSGWTVRAGIPTLVRHGCYRGEFNHSNREYIVLDSLARTGQTVGIVY